jgi:3-hydroxyisobutyrate dehydrogenase-like beta-hydroxyacid dehydrogenase
VIVGLVHPGEMGAAIGASVTGHEVIWASEGRSDASRWRATAFRDVGTLEALAAEADAIVSVCPPHAALDVARALAGFDGLYVDANAISPMHAQEIAELQRRFVDGGIIGGPESPRVYLSGDEAAVAASLFTVDTRVVSDASALKMAYAAWSKGTAALLLAIEHVAREYGVWDALAAEWGPELHERLDQAHRSAGAKGWRWIAEMEEIADTFAAAGAPDGFHRAAAEVYRS